MAKYNNYPGLIETVNLLRSLNTFSDKIIELYSQDTKDIEKQLKDAHTPEQIKTIILSN